MTSEEGKSRIVAIILPMYNEEKSIAALRNMFSSIPTLLPGYVVGIIVVDDGSTDRTRELVDQWALQDRRLTVVSHLRNMGLGQAVLTGMGEAILRGADCIITMDADATHTVKVIGRMVRAVIEEGADISIASRFTEGGAQVGVSLGRRILSWGVRQLFSLIFKVEGVTDYTTNFRAYRTELVSSALLKSSSPFLKMHTFAAVAELLLKLVPMAQKIIEVPLVLRYDFKKSSSKLKLLKTIVEYCRLCFQPKESGVLGRGLKIL